MRYSIVSGMIDDILEPYSYCQLLRDSGCEGHIRIRKLLERTREEYKRPECIPSGYEWDVDKRAYTSRFAPVPLDRSPAPAMAKCLFL